MRRPAHAGLREPVRLPFPDASFNALASIGGREAVGIEAASLGESARVPSPSGVFVCFHLPNHSSWIEFLGSRVPGKHHHLYRYGRYDVRRLVAAPGSPMPGMP